GTDSGCGADSGSGTDADSGTSAGTDGDSSSDTSSGIGAGGQIPSTVRIEGAEARVRRAWPGKKGRIAFEAIVDGGLRAGYLDGVSPPGVHQVTMLPAGHDPELPGLARLL
ncbi:hypothetical protein DN545_41115, partial [Burkholderia multivorans]